MIFPIASSKAIEILSKSIAEASASMQKKKQPCIDQSLPLVHKRPPDLFLSLASAQAFFFSSTFYY